MSRICTRLRTLLHITTINLPKLHKSKFCIHFMLKRLVVCSRVLMNWGMGFFPCVVHPRHTTNKDNVCLTLQVVNRINCLKTKIDIMTYIFRIENYLKYHSIKCVSKKMIFTKKASCNTRQCRPIQHCQILRLQELNVLELQCVMCWQTMIKTQSLDLGRSKCVYV